MIHLFYNFPLYCKYLKNYTEKKNTAWYKAEMHILMREVAYDTI